MNIPGYTIEKELRQGPITTVYLGRQSSLNRPVLIKTLNSRWINEKDLVKRFHREAQICAQLKHRNIVDIIDVSTDAENTWLVMDYVDGMDLEAFIKKHHPIPVELIIFITHEILQGLHYAHSKGVTHRDIKPANILIDQEGRVKIADFGLARADHLPDISMHGEIIGSPAYLSPEQAQAKKPDHRSDLFSLGITISELAGQPSPFKADNLVATVQKLMSHTPSPLNEIRSDIPAWLSQLVTKLLSKKPEQRPQSAGAVLASSGFSGMSAGESELQRFLNASPEQAPEQMVPDLLAVDDGQQRNLTPHLMATLFGGLLIILTVLSLIPDKYVRDVDLHSAPEEALLPVDSTVSTVDSLQSTLEGPTLEDTTEATLPSNGEPTAETRLINNGPQHIAVPETKPTQSVVKQAPLERPGTDGQDLEATYGQVMITCFPWAEIFLNGKRMDITPLDNPLLIASGRHKLELRHPHYPPITQHIKVAANSLDTLHFNFRAQSGSISVYVNPWAEVYLDGRHIGETPLEQHKIAAGKYQLRLFHLDYKVWEDTIRIEAGQELTKKIQLEKKP